MPASTLAPSEAEPDPAWLAVDLARVTGASAALAEWAAAVRARPALRGEVRLLERGTVPEALRGELDARGALHPVLSQGGARLVVLPELRAEVRPEAIEAVRGLAAAGPVAASVEERPGADGAAGTTLVLRPLSGRGADALALAGALRGRPGVAAVQPRFLRVLPRRDG